MPLLTFALSRFALFAALLFTMLLATGCVQSSQQSRSALPPAPGNSTPRLATDPTSLSSIITTTATLPPEGLISDIARVEVGHCFNNYRLENYRTGSAENIFTLVDCKRPHEGEVYHQVIHSAAPDAEYPGDRAMESWGQEKCYQTFEDWVGREFELSELDFSSIRPDARLWNDANDPTSRRLSCYIRSSDGSLLSGSHRNSNT